jgi:hypothetical protein
MIESMPLPQPRILTRLLLVDCAGLRHDPRMKKRLWKTLESSSLLAASTLAVGCGAPESGAEPEAAQPEPMGHNMASMPARGEGGEGEGEGGEGAGTGALLTDDAAYLAQVGLMRGHLWVGHQLYLAGLVEMAATHMKHPQAEIYSTLIDAFTGRDVPGFAEELTALADAVTGKEPEAAVQSAYDQLSAAIAVNERDGADTRSPAVIAATMVALLRTAGEEYAIGIVDEQVANVHEYQDALGFTQVARQWAASPAFAATPEAVAAAASLQAQLDALLPLWPTLAPEGPVPFSAERIYGAAARMEITALSLQTAP